MSKKIYVGNLPFTTTEGELRTLFEPFGTVDRVSVITDRESGRALRVNEASDRTAIGGGGRSTRI